MRDFLEDFFFGYVVSVLLFLLAMALLFTALGGIVGGIMIIVSAIAHGVPIFIFLGLFLIVVGILSAAGLLYMHDNS